MAGVGFELKKIFNERGIFKTLKAYVISSFVTVGPTAFCIIAIMSMQSIMRIFGASLQEREIFLGCITYSFAFSMILTGGISMLAVRYLADIIFQKRWQEITPSLYGFVCISLVVNTIFGVAFLLTGDLNGITSLLTLILYLSLSVIWIEMVYISAIKDYSTIAKIFAIGLFMTVVLFALLKFVGIFSVIDSVLISFNAGFMFMLIFFTLKIHSVFGFVKLKAARCFEFLKAIDAYPQMFIIGFLYYMGMYGHVFIYWFGKESINIKNTFVYNPIYDVPVFCSFLTILPLTVVFIVKLETTFYKKYREYYSMASGKGSIKDVKLAKDEMIASLHSQLKFAMEFQLFVAFISVIIGVRLLQQVGVSMLSVDVFVMLVFGCYCFSIMYLVILILLYFEDRKGAMNICILFSGLSIVLSIVAKLFGDLFYGYGFFYAALISFIVALVRLNNFLKELEYRTFVAQPIYVSRKVKLFGKIYYRFFGNGIIPETVKK